MMLMLVALSCVLLTLTSAADEISGPEVTLSHGGVLRGTTTDFIDKQVDVYLGK